MDSGLYDPKDLLSTSKFSSHLTKAGFHTAADVLCAPAYTIRKRTKLSSEDVQKLLKELSVMLCSLPRYETRTVAEMLELAEPVEPDSEREEEDGPVWRAKRITTGDEGLDLLLGDGIALGEVTEVAGQSASGKSNLCFQLSVTAQLPPHAGGLRGSTLFISSEGDLPSGRLLSLAEQYLPLINAPSAATLTSATQPPQLTAWDILDNIHLIKADESDKLDLVLSYQVSGAIEQIAQAAREARVLPRQPPPAPPRVPVDELEGEAEERAPRPSTSEFDLGRTRDRLPPLPVRLVVVDSIAAPFRGEGPGNWLARSKELARAGEMLKRIATRYEVAVVVVNQVSDVFVEEGAPPPRQPMPVSLHSLPSSSAPPPSKRQRLSSPTAHEGGHSLVPSSTPPLSPHSSSSSVPAGSQYSSSTEGPAFRLSSRAQTAHFSGQTRAFQSTAALGPTWVQQINTRLMLSRTERRRHRPGLRADGSVDSTAEGEVVRLRRLEVVFSARVPRGRIDYTLEHRGLVSVGGPQVRLAEGRYTDGDVSG